MPNIPTLPEYQLLLEALTHVPSGERNHQLQPFKQLFELGGGYEIFVETEAEAVPCEITGIEWHGHVDDSSAFSAQLAIAGEIVSIEFGELLRPIRRTLLDHSVYYGQRIRIADSKELAA